MIGVLLSLALPAAVAWRALGRFLPGRGQSTLAHLERLALSLLLAIGSSSVVAFFWLVAGGALDRSYAIFDGAFFGAVWLCLRGGRAPVERQRPKRARPAEALAIPALAAFGLVLAYSIWMFLETSRETPHGGWDAWAIWNQRARFLFRAGSEWRQAFAPELAWSQLGYPLLLPLSVARSWAYAGETTWGPIALAAVFTFGTAAVAGGAVSRAAGVLAGVTAALLLLGTPSFIYWGHALYADVATAGYLACGVSLLLTADRGSGEGRQASLVLAGLFLGFAGWTKNEGLAGAVFALTSHALIAARSRGSAAAAREARAVAWGAALPVAAWLAFHLSVSPAVMPPAPPNPVGVEARLLDAHRWAVVLSSLAEQAPGAEMMLPPVAVALAGMLGLRRLAGLVSAATFTAILLVVLDVAFFVATPWPLEWHLRTAEDRLLLHGWPALLIGLFAATTPAGAKAGSLPSTVPLPSPQPAGPGRRASATR